ncbi:MAG TPA: hypothetical protein VKU90_01840 [Caulobacteraceae bacterium]|nr:hypothetical protein [Caulobacteraceae bacterium]
MKLSTIVSAVAVAGFVVAASAPAQGAGYTTTTTHKTTHHVVHHVKTKTKVTPPSGYN